MLKLDKDKSGKVNTDELPTPKEKSRLKGKTVPAYSKAQLAGLFRAQKSKQIKNPEKFTKESVKYILESFDRDRDRHITKRELEMAANFAGLDLSVLRSKQDWYL